MFDWRLEAFKKLIEKYNKTGLWESDYEGIEVVTFLIYLIKMTVQTSLVPTWFTFLIQCEVASVSLMFSSCLTMKSE